MLLCATRMLNVSTRRDLLLAPVEQDTQEMERTAKVSKSLNYT